MCAKVLDGISAVGAGLSPAGGSVDIKYAYLHIPIFSCPPKVSAVCGGGMAIPVCGPVVWSVHGSQSVDQGPGSCSQGVMLLRYPCFRALGPLSEGTICSFLETNIPHTVYTLERFRRVLNIQKSALNPAQGLEYLGLILDTSQLRVILPPGKCHALRTQVDFPQTLTNRLILFCTRAFGKMVAFFYICGSFCPVSFQTPLLESLGGMGTGGHGVWNPQCHPEHKAVSGLVDRFTDAGNGNIVFHPVLSSLTLHHLSVQGTLVFAGEVVVHHNLGTEIYLSICSIGPWCWRTSL